MDRMVNNIQLTWKLAWMLRTCNLMLKFSKYMLRTCRTYNSTLKFSKYEFYNKLLGGVTLLKITLSVTLHLI